VRRHLAILGGFEKITENVIDILAAAFVLDGK
jgi:F0F1-type ATP synthase epsilon subunit